MSRRGGMIGLLLVICLAWTTGMGCHKDGNCIPGPSTYCGDDDDDHTPVEPVCDGVDPSIVGLSIPFETLVCVDPVVGDDEWVIYDEGHEQEPVGTALRTQEELDGYLTQYFAQQYQDCSVDLAQKTVLAAYVWVGCLHCQRLEICGVYDAGDRLMVSANHYLYDGAVPADCCLHTYHLVAIDRTERPIEFVFHDVWVDPEVW